MRASERRDARVGVWWLAMALLTDSEIHERLAGAPRWRREGEQIVCERTFTDFVSAIAFVDRVAELAQDANHHPDILVHGYKHVRLTLSTHSQGGLTAADFELAGRIDGLD